MVNAIACVLVGTGLWMSVSLASSYAHLGETLRAAVAYAGPALATVLAAQLLVPVLKMVAGLGLLSGRSCWLPVARVALALDVLALGVSVVRLYAPTGAPPDGAGTEAGTIVQRISAVPMIVIWLSSLIGLALLGVKSPGAGAARVR